MRGVSMTEQAEEPKKFEKGDLIFQQGDPGGDLFFILDGEVEIFTSYEGHEVVLSTMKKGEVIGTMTCLTKAPRVASARAKGPVQVKYVSNASISRLIAALPKWMTVVLKDIQLRIASMNESFSEASMKVRKLEVDQITPMYIASLIARIISTVAPDKQKKFDDVPGLLPQDMAEYIEPMLGRPRNEIDAVIDIFMNCGIIDLKLEQEKKRKYFTLANAVALKDFAEFVDQTKRKKIKTILESKFSGKENRVIVGLLRYADVKEAKREANVTYKVAELESNLKKVTGQDFELEALQLAENFKMVRLEGKGETASVSFTPQTVGHVLAHVKAYEMLLKVRWGSKDKESK